MRLQLRPHHLLCIQKFTGHGYDEAFTTHMTSVTAGLAENPNTPITITRGCDELCNLCPHNSCGVCTTLEKVNLMDSAVLTACGLTYGDEFSWGELARTAREKVFAGDAFPGICGSCQWFELCKNTEDSKDGGIV